MAQAEHPGCELMTHMAITAWLAVSSTTSEPRAPGALALAPPSSAHSAAQRSRWLTACFSALLGGITRAAEAEHGT